MMKAGADMAFGVCRSYPAGRIEFREIHQWRQRHSNEQGRRNGLFFKKRFIPPALFYSQGGLSFAKSTN